MPASSVPRHPSTSDQNTSLIEVVADLPLAGAGGKQADEFLQSRKIKDQLILLPSWMQAIVGKDPRVRRRCCVRVLRCIVIEEILVPIDAAITIGQCAKASQIIKIDNCSRGAGWCRNQRKGSYSNGGKKKFSHKKTPC